MAGQTQRGGLVLTRRIRERVKIGEDVYVSILSVRGGAFRMLIEAPKSIPVHREENVTKAGAR